MGKRSNFERIPKDKYPTPYSAVVPLLPFLKEGTHFSEPCAGNGILIDHLHANGHVCESAYDIEPERDDITKKNALDVYDRDVDCFITNPPWSRPILHDLIIHLSNQADTWLLFDADWMHTIQSAEYMQRCRKIVSVGRVKWMPGSKHVGMDNAAWYLFTDLVGEPTEFYGRTKKTGEKDV